MKNKTIEGNSYISTYSCVNYVSYYLNESLGPLNSTCLTKWLFTSLGSDLYTIQVNDSKGSYLASNNSSIELSDEMTSWKLYQTDNKTYDGLTTYLIQNTNTCSYLAFNTSNGSINYWKNAETDTWKKTWVIADKPYCTVAPKPVVYSDLLISAFDVINGCNRDVLETYTNNGIKMISADFASDKTYYTFYYNELNNSYAIYCKGDSSYLTRTKNGVATTSTSSESIWKKYDYSYFDGTNNITYSLLQENSLRNGYLCVNNSTCDIDFWSTADGSETYKTKFVINKDYYVVPTTAAPTTAAPTTAAPTTAAPKVYYYGIYRWTGIGTVGDEKALQMGVVDATSTSEAQRKWEASSVLYDNYFYKPASSSDYSESKMANYTWMLTKGNRSGTPSWSGGKMESTPIVGWYQVPE